MVQCLTVDWDAESVGTVHHVKDVRQVCLESEPKFGMSTMPHIPPPRLKVHVSSKGMLGHEDPQPVSDNERLIAVLQTCFYDLIRKQEEIHKAVEALKPQASTTDKKTAFWTSYMKLADEHDKEFQQKYSTDLDTALIFAGLFSAISSAFIIQIQPQPTSPFSVNTVAVLSLLYISLFTTLLAALLTVLGKQWIMYYQAAGSRGTIEERGLERQRKLDGLRKWKFDAVLQVFPVLLQLALLLFASAISVYLWPIHHSIAAIVIALTVFGFASYIFLLASTIVSPDSPFQTPLASLLSQMGSGIWRILKPMFVKIYKAAKNVWYSLSQVVKSRTFILPFFMSQTSSNPDRPGWEVYPHWYFSETSVEVSAVMWILETSTDPTVVTAAAELAVDLQWPLDLDLTSAIMSLDELFHSCFDLDLPHSRVKLRMEMGDRAIKCCRAYCSLRNIVQASGRPFYSSIPWSYPWISWDNENVDPLHLTQFSTVIQFYRKWSDAIGDPGDLMSSDKWAFHTFASLDPDRHITSGQKGLEHFLDQLHVDKIPSLEESTFTDYLCCINSFLAPVNPRMLVEVDKSRLRLPLMVQLFKVLQRQTTKTSLAARIISTTAHLMNQSVITAELWSWDVKDLMTEICQFCSTFPPGHESLQVLVSAATLARVEDPKKFEDMEIEGQNSDWIFSSLEYVQQLWEESPNAHQGTEEWDSTTTLAVRSLLQFLICSSLPFQPPLRSLHIILRALSAPEDTSQIAARVLYRAPRNWFFDPTSQPLMQENSVWSQLGCFTLKYSDPISLMHYLSLGEDIAKTAEWKLIIYEDLSTWMMITLFMSDTDRFLHYTNLGSATFVSVIRSIWVPEFSDQMQLLNERNESWVLALTALANVWNTFQFSSMHVLACLHLARCTVSTSLRVQYFYWEHDYTQKPIPRDIRVSFAPQLGEALIQAAGNARNTLTRSSPPPLGDMGEEESHNTTPPFEPIAAMLGCWARSFAPNLNRQVETCSLSAKFDVIAPVVYNVHLSKWRSHWLKLQAGSTKVYMDLAGKHCEQNTHNFLRKAKLEEDLGHAECIYQIYIGTNLSPQRASSTRGE
ncbi:hypothetical protein B0H13DRAFT_2414885 [Mycena leptocephala]|nr:hypothetical protein B0H13DRAFT_2414885 [Mycena leptocephala]